MELTERAGRSIRPTAAGEAYARYAADILALLKEGSDAWWTGSPGARVPHLRRAVTTAGEYLPPPLLRAFRDRAPDLEVTVHVGNREEVFRRLEAHEADVAISGRPRRARLRGGGSSTLSSS